MDAIEQLVWDSETAVAVLGAGDDFTLVELSRDGQPLPQAVLDDAKRRGFMFCGVLVVGPNGEPAAKCEPGAGTAYTMLHAALVAFRDEPKKDWLERLWELPDARN